MEINKYWSDYTLLRGTECSEYAKEKLLNDKILFMLGNGFDERMCEGIERMYMPQADMEVWLIEYSEARNSNSLRYLDKVTKNNNRLLKCVPEDRIKTKHIDMWEQRGGEEIYVSELRAAKLIKENSEELNAFDAIIVDISALPQAIYFSLLDTLLSEYYPDKKIFIIACENYRVDQKTNPVGLSEDAHYYFRYGSTDSKDNEVPLIWLPVMGEGSLERLSRCYDYIKRGRNQIDEICPLLPFPSLNERRSDEILLHLHEQLFNIWGIEKKNIIYASETNPFQVYRRICETAEHYDRVLMPLFYSSEREREEQKENGWCLVLTALTSKLMSVGTFLAAYNLKKESFNVYIAGVTNRGYSIAENRKTKLMKNASGETEVFCLCLCDDGFDGR